MKKKKLTGIKGPAFWQGSCIVDNAPSSELWAQVADGDGFSRGKYEKQIHTKLYNSNFVSSWFVGNQRICADYRGRARSLRAAKRPDGGRHTTTPSASASGTAVTAGTATTGPTSTNGRRTSTRRAVGRGSG